MKVLIIILSLTYLQSWAKDYEVFDGRTYNGKYYPRIDVVTWNEKKGDPFTQQYHIYWKGHPVDLAFELEETSAGKVMLVKYIFKERNEELCRRVPAPSNFSSNFKIFKDTSDKDMDMFIISMEDLPKKSKAVAFTPIKYVPCKEEPETTEVSPGPAAAKQPEAKNPTEVQKDSTDQKKLNEEYNFFN